MGWVEFLELWFWPRREERGRERQREGQGQSQSQGGGWHGTRWQCALPSKQLTEMTDLLTCLTRLTNFIISLEERAREESERWDNDAGVRILHRNLGLLVEFIHSIIGRHIWQ